MLVGQALERDKKLCAALAEIRAADGIRIVEERMQVRTMPHHAAGHWLRYRGFVSVG